LRLSLSIIYPVTRVLASQSASVPSFTEAEAWRVVGGGWNPLFSSFVQTGVSLEWHDFTSAEPLDWGRSFHPGSIELCLNLGGSGTVSAGKTRVELSRHSAAFYHHGTTPLSGQRVARERHQFLTVEYSVAFLQQHFAPVSELLHPLVRSALNKNAPSEISALKSLTSEQIQVVQSLRNPSVPSCALPLWYQIKALELAAHFFFQQPNAQELFCHRHNRVAHDRVEKVIAILRENLATPPTLDQIGAQVGCSPFYLSRTFSKEVGMTLPQFIRKLRMERAAELLRAGKHNVTEAAFEVGYSSLSHFSQAFHAVFGVCPGLYPILPPSRK
jgi:AraC family transcriptional regulator